MEFGRLSPATRGSCSGVSIKIMITFFTLVLDGMPWVTHHYPVFCQLKVPWRWIVIEGVADNVNCTSWCAKIPPRLSNDGTNEYLRYLCAKDSRVTHISQPVWAGKVEMCNAALFLIREPCLLWQVDSDELWTPNAIDKTFNLFQVYDVNAAYFRCRYFVGLDRYVCPVADTYGNHTAYEWWRVWNFTPGMKFKTHEPPVLFDGRINALDQWFTSSRGIQFDHMAYATRKQMEFRAQYYAGSTNPNAHLWRNCVQGWERLQAVTTFPVKLKDYFPWVDDRAEVVHI